MAATLFSNVMVFDGTGSESFPGEVLVENNRIKAVAKGRRAISADGAQVVDGDGATLMPGLVEAHSHITYIDIPTLRALGDIPPEEHMLRTYQNAQLMLQSGFTSLYSAATSKPRLEVALRNEIEAGRMPGPRIKAASPELTPTGGLGDERQLHMFHTGIEWIADGVDEIRKAVRTLIRERVDTIKVNLSGDNFVRTGFGEALAYTEGEIAAAAEQAHEWGCWLSCHARANRSVKLAVKYGFRVIYHCDFADAEAIDLLESKKNEIFLAPAIGLLHATAHEAGDWGITKEVATQMGMYKMLETSPPLYRELKRRGLRILPGGDYGFAWNPVGTNTRDLEHFVNMYGFSHAEALMSATKWGGELMGMDLGQVKDGYLADLILVDGDPTKDVTILQDRDNIVMVMKDGHCHKGPLPRRMQQQRKAA